MKNKNNYMILVSMILTVIILCSISSANYYIAIVPPDSVMNIENTDDLEPYLSSDSEVVKIWGIIRLGQIGDKSDIDRLVEIFNNESDQKGFMPPPRIKYYSLVAIGEIGGEKAEKAIMRIARQTQFDIDANSRNIEAGITNALGEIASPTAIDTLRSMANFKAGFGDAAYARMNLLNLELRNAEFKTFQDSITYLLNELESSNSRENQFSRDLDFVRRAVELTLLDILKLKDVKNFQRIYKDAGLDRQTTHYCEKIVSLVQLGMKWHGGRYSLPDLLAGAVPTVISNSEIDSLSKLLDKCHTPTRFSIFHNIVLSEDADTSKFIDLILRSLVHETEYPYPLAHQSGTPLTYSILRDYVMCAVDNAPGYSARLDSIADYSTGYISSWAAIISGILGDHSVKSRLAIAASDHSNPYVRFWAIWALDKFGDPEYYDIFVDALTDPFNFRVYSDIFLEDGSSLDHDSYIVRGAAFEALRNLGYSVTWDSTGNFQIQHEKK